MPAVSFLALLFGSLAASGATAADLFGNVVSVADGDTITVLDGDSVQHKIRLEGIDAPERRQPFGTRSRQNMSDLVFGKGCGSKRGNRIATAERSARCG